MDEYRIVELVKDRYRTGSIKADDRFLLNNATIISIESYENSYQYNPSISKQVIGYVFNDPTSYASALEFPMLQWHNIPYAYLYKKGYLIIANSPFGPAPLPNLKYIIYCISSDTRFTSSAGYKLQNRLVIELVDLDVVSNNVNLPKIMSSVLGSKLLIGNKMNESEFYKINEQMLSQKLFADHTWRDAQDIVFRYFEKNERDLSKEVFKISEAYERVFRPYRVVYDTKTWQPVVM